MTDWFNVNYRINQLPLDLFYTTLLFLISTLNFFSIYTFSSFKMFNAVLFTKYTENTRFPILCYGNAVILVFTVYHDPCGDRDKMIDTVYAYM